MIRGGNGKLKGRRNHRKWSFTLIDSDRWSNCHLLLDRETRRAIVDNQRRLKRALDRAIFETMMMGCSIEELPFI